MYESHTEWPYLLERDGVVEFDWDRAKAASNLRKHRVSFELAATVFADWLATSVPDEDHGAFEERWITMGVAEDGRLLVLSHTSAADDGGEMLVRIISARPATPRERRQYESGT